MGLFGDVPEKGGFQARGSSFLWGRARKGGCFGHEGPLFFGVVPEKGAVSGTGVASVRPDVPKASSQRTRYAEVKKDSVQICRTSIRNRLKGKTLCLSIDVL